MLKLTIFPEGFNEPSGSPFAVKALCLVENSGQPYEVIVTPDPRKAPKQKLPVLEDGANIIPDSDQIRDYLESTYDIDFDKGLSAEQRAVSRSIIRMMEEHVYFAIYSDRWQDDDNWSLTKNIYFNDMPPVIGGFITNQIRKGAVAQITGQGMGRHSPAEQAARIEKDFAAVETILGDKPFLFGEIPTAADYTAVPFLAAAAAFPSETQLTKIVQSRPNLMAYIARGKDAFYPK